MNSRSLRSVLVCQLAAALLMGACSSGSNGQSGENGGSLAATGGVSTGGDSMRGGTAGAGASTSSQGGAASSSGGASGTHASGGSTSGGTSPTGGTVAFGGTSASSGGIGSTSGGRNGGGAPNGGRTGGGMTGGTGGASSAAGGTGGRSSSSSGGAGGSTAPAGKAPYKGVANSPAAQLSALGATWCYNWGTTPKATDCNDPLFVPMVWGKDNVESAVQAIGKAGYTTLLGFNEPNKSDQANMSVAEALALWPTLTSNPNIRVGSPAVSDDGRAWLEDFMTQAKKQGLRVDFIAMHWYGWNKGSCTAGSLEGAINWASKWNLPVWITEFGCMGSSNPDEQTLLDFFKNAIPMIAKHSLVERYAWYPWNTYNHLYENNAITALGQAFAAAPQYRQ
ncbi:MAG TPA: glycosyl hydrolase [Polyangiaceae bacterium]|nr:glycosyl hydrolase [Polyangiaceae bacterium]